MPHDKNNLTTVHTMVLVSVIFAKDLLKLSNSYPLTPEPAKIFPQGFSPTLSTITRQPIELESCGKPQEIPLDQNFDFLKIWMFWI